MDENRVEKSVVYNYSDKFPCSPQKISLYTDVLLNENMMVFGRLEYEFARDIFHFDFEGNFIEKSACNGKIKSALVFEFGLSWRKFK